MKCPNDAATLVMSERSGVEIDYCPECRGVWLDRGELDKILERAEGEFRAAAPQAPAPQAPAPQAPAPQAFPAQTPGFNDRNRGYDTNFGRDRDYDNRGYGQGRKKKESWLSELFD
jgi:Zn-finger nucleic acid-binding protein